jgi:hypothetical protein
MNEFTILTNRKRAVIALIHSVVFSGVALHGFVSPKTGVLRHAGSDPDFLLIMIYMTVTSILGWLVGISRALGERLYFAFCMASAGFGLLRMIFGDEALPAAQYVRVAMLTSAVAVGSWILYSFSRPVAEDVLSE